MNDKKYLQSVQPKRNQLQNSGVDATDLITNAFANLDESALKEITKKAAEEKIYLEKKKINLMIDREEAINAVGLHLETLDVLDSQRGRNKKRIGERIRDGEFVSSSVKITNDIKTGAGNMRIETKSAGTCFVATAAYEDESHPDVVFLRLFRDGFLSRYSLGNKFILWYYKNGPKMACKVKKHPYLKAITLHFLKGLVFIMKKSHSPNV
jgi:hypothetical protein